MTALERSTHKDWQQRIICVPKILAGKPTVKGTRISVELILGWVSSGWTTEQVPESYPNITRDDVLAAFAYAQELRHDNGILPIAETAPGVTLTRRC